MAQFSAKFPAVTPSAEQSHERWHLLWIDQCVACRHIFLESALPMLQFPRIFGAPMLQMPSFPHGETFWRAMTRRCNNYVPDFNLKSQRECELQGPWSAQMIFYWSRHYHVPFSFMPRSSMVELSAKQFCCLSLYICSCALELPTDHLQVPRGWPCYAKLLLLWNVIYLANCGLPGVKGIISAPHSWYDVSKCRF